MGAKDAAEGKKHAGQSSDSDPRSGDSEAPTLRASLRYGDHLETPVNPDICTDYSTEDSCREFSILYSLCRSICFRCDSSIPLGYHTINTFKAE